jgi:osmotically-inducible protein OsmY
MARNKDQIKSAITDRIISDDRVDASDIGVHVDDKHVVLCGIVPSSLERDIATDVALRVAGVESVDNQLEVQPPREPEPTDKELETQVHVAVSKFPGTRAGQVRAEVENRVVTLTGSVDTLRLKVQVERVVSEVAGVTAVRNDLDVLPPSPVSDQEIAKAILDALERSESIDDETIDVTVEEGVVILSGCVSSDSASQIADNAAINTVGVKELRNHLVKRAP